MAKLYFYFSAMNAGKSTVLLQSAHNYKEQGMKVLIYTSYLDDRFQTGYVSSRIGLSSPAKVFNAYTNMFLEIQSVVDKENIKCVLVDECQFLSKRQVLDLARVVDELKIPVLAYGLRTDFQGELFEGSQHLLALAEELSEIKTICECGRKATMNARVNREGELILKGEQIDIGGNEKYISMCRRCYCTKAKETNIKSKVEVI
ncbi:thymidine kinase [Gammaproteobacteria bacterium]|nr:thymidine kinase [Gammaproteobacteria bacterium]